MRRIQIVLDDEAFDRLVDRSLEQERPVRDEAARIVRRALEVGSRRKETVTRKEAKRV